MDSPTSPGDPVVLPNAHSALINNKLDEFLNSFTRVNRKKKHKLNPIFDGSSLPNFLCSNFSAKQL